MEYLVANFDDYNFGGHQAAIGAESSGLFSESSYSLSGPADIGALVTKRQDSEELAPQNGRTSLAEYQPIDTIAYAGDVDIITGISTPIKGGNEGMIASRFQDHSWVTDDGAVHILANVEDTLTMYSSRNDGASWKKMAVLRQSREFTRSDGILVGNDLYNIYTASNGRLRLATFKYSESKFSWKLSSDLALPKTAGLKLEHPSITVGPDGLIVVTASAKEQRTRKTSLKIFSSENGGESWTMESGSIANKAGDGRIVGDIMTTDKGVGILYSDGPTLNWVELDKLGSSFSILEPEQILIKGDEQVDPNSTHFSSLIDEEGNIHVATNDGLGHTVYLRYDKSRGGWDDPVQIAGYYSGEYMQISTLEDGSLQIAYNVRRDEGRFLEVSQSLDGGDSWDVIAELTQDIVRNPGNIRMETPAYGKDSLAVFQQCEGTLGINELVYYQFDPT